MTHKTGSRILSNSSVTHTSPHHVHTAAEPSAALHDPSSAAAGNAAAVAVVGWGRDGGYSVVVAVGEGAASIAARGGNRRVGGGRAWRAWGGSAEAWRREGSGGDGEGKSQDVYSEISPGGGRSGSSMLRLSEVRELQVLKKLDSPANKGYHIHRRTAAVAAACVACLPSAAFRHTPAPAAGRSWRFSARSEGGSNFSVHEARWGFQGQDRDTPTWE